MYRVSSTQAVSYLRILIASLWTKYIYAHMQKRQVIATELTVLQFDSSRLSAETDRQSDCHSICAPATETLPGAGAVGAKFILFLPCPTTPKSTTFAGAAAAVEGAVPMALWNAALRVFFVFSTSWIASSNSSTFAWRSDSTDCNSSSPEGAPSACAHDPSDFKSTTTYSLWYCPAYRMTSSKMTYGGAKQSLLGTKLWCKEGVAFLRSAQNLDAEAVGVQSLLLSWGTYIVILLPL